jgi:hypothetical protein
MKHIIAHSYNNGLRIFAINRLCDMPVGYNVYLGAYDITRAELQEVGWSLYRCLRRYYPNVIEPCSYVIID